MSAPFDHLPRRDYRIVLADPAWAFKTFTSSGRTPTQKTAFNNAEDHYPTMSLADMAALPVGDVVAKDSILVMWVVGSHLDQALQLGAAWGFDYVTDLFWWLKQKLVHADQIHLFSGDIAEPAMSMGYHSRKQGEMCLLFRRGKGLPVLAHDVRQIIIEPRREHSRKPDCQYDRLARLYGSPSDDLPCLELFCRSNPAGWDAWGNEVGKFVAEIAA